MCPKIQKWFDSHFTTKYINRNSYSITLPFISNNKDYMKIIFHIFKCLVVLGKINDSNENYLLTFLI